MTAQELSIGGAGQPMNSAGSSEVRQTESRNRVAGLLLFVALLAALAAAGWGVLSSLGDRDEVPARVGEPVAVSGGVLSVDSVAPESMAPMQMGKFSASGMNMSGAGMDMAPEGQRRFTVEVTLAAGEASSLAYSADDFRISGDGLEVSGPYRDQLAGESLSPESAVSGTLVFQVPDKAKNLMLSFDDGRQVALDLPPASGDHGHSSGGGQGGGHDH